MINDAELLKKYTNIWIKASNSSKKELGCKPVCIKTHLTFLRSYGDETTSFSKQKNT